MATIPKRVADRLAAGVKKFQPVLAAARSRDVNESDTVVILTDILADVYGYDKYTELTSELSIRGTFCDLAIKLDGKIQTLIEAKAVGVELKDAHVKQAIDYAANQGVDWVVLTNGSAWRIYKVLFGKPIEQELVCEFDFSSLESRSEEHLQLLFLLTKEGWSRSAVGDFHLQRQALSRFFVAGALFAEPVLSAIRRELKRLSPDVRIESEQIESVLKTEVIKRDVLEGEKFAAALKAIGRAAAKAQKSNRPKDCGSQDAVVVCVAPPAQVLFAEPVHNKANSVPAPAGHA